MFGFKCCRKCDSASQRTPPKIFQEWLIYLQKPLVMRWSLLFGSFIEDICCEIIFCVVVILFVIPWCSGRYVFLRIHGPRFKSRLGESTRSQPMCSSFLSGLLTNGCPGKPEEGKVWWPGRHTSTLPYLWKDRIRVESSDRPQLGVHETMK